MYNFLKLQNFLSDFHVLTNFKKKKTICKPCQIMSMVLLYLSTFESIKTIFLIGKNLNTVP